MDDFARLESGLKARLGEIPPDNIVFVGVGNRFRGDDATGPLIIDMIADHVPNAIDAGPAPENVTGAIKRLKPKAIVFVDALIFGDRAPGTPAIVEIDEVRHLGESTHTLSLDVVMEYLQIETGADVFMIGVQPQRIADGEGLSPGMRDHLQRLAAVIVEAIGTP
jgi:hydrogenase 3 maturation protease